MKTVQAAYAEGQAKAKELLDRLSAALASHEKAASLKPKNWDSWVTSIRFAVV